jgi:hypothetical protein
LSGEIEDPVSFIKENGSSVGVLNDFLNMWTKTVEELLLKMADTIPGEGMLGEVHYWRDLSKILDGLQAELKQPKVEMSV